MTEMPNLWQNSTNKFQFGTKEVLLKPILKKSKKHSKAKPSVSDALNLLSLKQFEVASREEESGL